MEQRALFRSREDAIYWYNDKEQPTGSTRQSSLKRGTKTFVCRRARKTLESTKNTITGIDCPFELHLKPAVQKKKNGYWVLEG